MGVVLPQTAFKALSRDRTAGRAAHRLIADTPAVARLMAQAERRWPVRVERDFSYGARTTPAIAGSSSATPGRSSIPCSRAASRSPSNRGSRGPERSTRGSRAATAPHAPSAFRSRGSARAIGRSAASCRLLHAGVPRSVLQPDPPGDVRAVVTVLAGYWRPAWNAGLAAPVLSERPAAGSPAVRAVPRRRPAPDGHRPIADPQRAVGSRLDQSSREFDTRFWRLISCSSTRNHATATARANDG